MMDYMEKKSRKRALTGVKNQTGEMIRTMGESIIIIIYRKHSSSGN